MRAEVEIEEDLTELPVLRVVVAEDASPASWAGLAAAAQLARRNAARITVVHVRHWPGLYMAGLGALGMAGMTAGEMVRSLDLMEDAARRRATKAFAGTGAKWDFQVREGQPAREIVRAAEELDADLVVIGSDRHGALHNLIVGSTTAYVTAHSSVPVLVVRPSAGGRQRPSGLRRRRRAERPEPALSLLPSL
jgi:nucleotide-binding universal stress UspA family protein